jgi:hypothetical protein
VWPGAENDPACSRELKGCRGGTHLVDIHASAEVENSAVNFTDSRGWAVISATKSRAPPGLIDSTCRASCAARLGRIPNEHGNMSASKIGSSTILAAAYTMRSRTVGIEAAAARCYRAWE